MSRVLLRGGVAVVASAVLSLFAAAPAFAHEQRTVGAYMFTVGWQHEPTYTGTLNAVQLFIHDVKGNPIDDIGSPPTLQVTVATGTPAKTSDPLELKASFDPDTSLGMHGEFDAAVIPTAPGTYMFHFTGTLGGQKIDEKFISSDKTFDNVADPTAVEFPAAVPTGAALSTSISRLTPRVDNAVTVGGSARDRAGSATTLAVVALVVGGVLGVAGIAVGLTARRLHA
ncbi:MAG TPA: hypothetical protein VHT75_02915 [Acidimicrobiales bacterium]|jgi:hypothetical protein|nr:hypothetical protein [Acidimicrobiales bacterium]